jgi:hypothetical protein
MRNAFGICVSFKNPTSPSHPVTILEKESGVASISIDATAVARSRSSKEVRVLRSQAHTEVEFIIRLPMTGRR